MLKTWELSVLLSSAEKNKGPAYWLIISVIPLLCIVCEAIYRLLDVDMIAVSGLSSAALENGQYWRLLSANLVHTNTVHLVMNLAGFYLIFVFCSERCPPGAFSLFTLSCGVLSLTILSWWLNISWYVGLSSALHGLLALLVATAWARDRLLSLGVALLVIVKLGIEAREGGDTLSSALIGAPVFWQSHITGVVAGVVLTPPLLGLTKRASEQ
ncbi:MAG: rhombosortase [Exilibacterium sp.]